MAIHANQALRVVAGLDRRDRALRARCARRPAARRLRVPEDAEDHELSVDRRAIAVDLNQQAVGGVVAPSMRGVRLHHVSGRLGDRLAADELPEHLRLAVGRVVVEDRHARLRREERRHGVAVALVVRPDVVGEDLLHSQFIRHRNLHRLIVIVINTYSQLDMQQ